MRYEDWDVLLFLAGDDPAAHIPIQEFKTSCCAIKDRPLEVTETTRAKSITPLITSFIPSLREGAPFQISVHSWRSRDFHFKHKPNLENPGLEQLWQVKVFVDKVCVCEENFPLNVTWPKVIHIANMVERATFDEDEHEDDAGAQPLRFPRFHNSVLSQTAWDATDMMGRIRVEVAEGYNNKIRGDKTTFVKLMNHGYFSFQPAPLDILQRAGIAWPNPQIFAEAKYPLPMQHNFISTRAAYSRNASSAGMNSIWSSSPLGLPGVPPPNPTTADYSMAYRQYANSSRSTSAYTTVPFEALPMPRPSNYAINSPQYPDTATEHPPMRTRLSSDQMEQLINAIRPTQPDFTTVNAASNSMPPPSKALHALPTKENIKADVPSKPGAALQVAGSSERRGANASDVSMHPECLSYPACTSEDENGRVIHNPHPSPAVVLRSRKEGSKDLNQRDFLSNLLNPETSSDKPDPVAENGTADAVSSSTSSSPTDATTKKRTRSTMKSLNGNENSPQKVDVDMDKENEVAKPARKDNGVMCTMPSH